jgi:hypothetical protein
MATKCENNTRKANFEGVSQCQPFGERSLELPKKVKRKQDKNLILGDDYDGGGDGGSSGGGGGGGGGGDDDDDN